MESLGRALQIWRELAKAGHLGRELDTGAAGAGEIGFIDCAKARQAPRPRLRDLYRHC